MSQMYTEDDIDDLIRINIELTKENNRLLKKMRRAQVMGSVWKFIWILILLGVPAAAYYFYLAPYVEEAQAIYQETRQSIDQMRELQNNVQASVADIPSRFSELFKGAEVGTTTTPEPPEQPSI